MNSRALGKVVKEVRDIASFAHGEPVGATIDMEVLAYNWRHQGKQPLDTRFALYILGDEVASFRGTWKETLSLVEWLKDIEVPVKYSANK